MPDKSDTKILQVLCRQTRQDRVVDLILAECRLIFFEAKPPQPTSDVHDHTHHWFAACQRTPMRNICLAWYSPAASGRMVAALPMSTCPLWGYESDSSGGGAFGTKIG